AVTASVFDVSGTPALAVTLPPAGGAGSRALTLARPCTCLDGWSKTPVGPAPAWGEGHQVFDVQVFPAGPLLGKALLELINQTKSRLDANAYLITSEDFVKALGQASLRGVGVRLLLEPSPAG